MNYIVEAERILDNYKLLQESLPNLYKRKNILAMKGAPTEIRGNVYDKVLQDKGCANSTINNICELLELNNDIKETEVEINFIADILEQIKKENPILEKFLRLRYIKMKNEPLKKVAVEMGYSEESNHTIYAIKNDAIRKFAILYFGSIAYKYT